MIVFTRKELDTYTRLDPTPLESHESIDMLRLMEHGRPVRMVTTERDTLAVDCPEDLLRVEAELRRDPLTTAY